MLGKQLLVIALVSLTGFATIRAQVTLPLTAEAQDAFKNGTRTISGNPGKNYWQNTADYVIKVDFNPESRLVKGTVEIVYTNNSPDTLRQIAFKLYPNLYKSGSIRQMPIRPEDVTNGVAIDTITINDAAFNTRRLRISGTNMTVPVTPLYPKQNIRFSIGFSYTLNKTSHIRTGEIEPGADFIAYFFPRIAVYDDIDGWNMNPYTGTQEFYNDFCNFKASVTVPRNFIVWATGDLLNCDEVFNDKYCDLIKQAEQSDETVTIIDTTDLQQGNITRNNAFNTWQFSADNVTDFVFAVSDHYIWKSSSLVVDSATKRRSRVDAVFNPKHKDYYEVVDFNRTTVWAMSHLFPKWPFPYSHETIFDGLDQMEYPMMVNDNPLQNRADAIELTDHEVFHTMFPFYLGINETKYAWMDEGWATIGEWLISSVIDSSLHDDYGVLGYERQAGGEEDLPIMTLSTQMNGTAYFINAYPKPGLGYLYVKDMLGDALFTKALHYYIEQWRGKHPIPYDFFNCMNTGSGKNLNWFWKQWFFDDGVPDLAIQKVIAQSGKYVITIEKKGHKPVPVDLVLTFTDGTTTKLHRSIAVWEKSSILTLTIPVSKTVKNITLGSLYIPDVNRADNKWERK